MRFAGFKRNRTFALVGVVSATLVVAATASALGAGVQASPTRGSVHVVNGAAQTTRAVVRQAGMTNVRQLSTTPRTRQAPRVPLPVLLPHALASQAGQAPYVAHPAPLAAGTRIPQRDPVNVLKNFDGVSAIQNQQVAFPLEPPDEGLGAGNGFVANFVNVTGGIYNPSGGVLAGPFYLNDFFGETADANTSDPRVFYDSATGRWFATILEYDFDSDGNLTGSRVDVAVSTSGDPTGTWKRYRIDATNPSHNGCPCLADYPILGIDAQNVYISTNEFTQCLCQFNGAQLYALSKSQLVAGQNTVNTVFFENLAMAGSPAFHVQPANEYGTQNAEWALNSLDPNGTSDHRVGVWAVTNEQAVTSGHGMPVLSARVVQSEAYAFPPNAKNPKGFCQSCSGGSGAPTTGLIQTNWDAMQETQYMDGQLIGALNTAVTMPGETHTRTGVAWFLVRPSLSGSSVSSATHVARQGYVAVQGEYLAFPHINMVMNGDMAITFSIGNKGTYLSAAFTSGRNKRDFNTTSVRVAGAGTDPDNGFTGTQQYGGANRWGDYSNGEYIPGTNHVWLATQYIPNSGTGYINWGNRIFELELP